MKNILIYNWWDIKNPKAGGAEVHLNALFSRLAEKGYSITLVCSRFPGSKKKETVNNIVIRRIAPWWLINIASVFWYFIYRNNFDLIVDYTNKIPYLTPLYVRRKPVVAFALHVFGDIWVVEWGLIGKLFNQIEQVLYRCYRRTKTIAISQSTKKDLIRLGFNKNNIEVIYPGVNYSVLTKAEKSRTPTVIYLGRLKKYKKIDLIIKSWSAISATFPEAKLWIVGSGSDEARLKRLAGIKNIIFCGQVSEKEKFKYLRKAWLLIQPSTKEGWGLTVMEAATVGTPSLVASSPGLSEVVKDGLTGWVLKDPKEIARTVVDILSNNAKRREVSQNAFSNSKRYSWDQSAEELKRYLQKG